MTNRTTLSTNLIRRAKGDQTRVGLSVILAAITDCGARLSRQLSRPQRLDATLNALDPTTASNPARALQHYLGRQFEEALQHTPITLLACGEQESLRQVNPDVRYGAVLTPLTDADGIDTGQPIGILFSIIEAGSAQLLDISPRNQLCAAGLISYGPQTRLHLSLGDGTLSYALEPGIREFVLLNSRTEIPPAGAQLLVNTASYRYWSERFCRYIDERIADTGDGGTIHWPGTPTSGLLQILAGGGAYVDPADNRPGFSDGRNRLLFEAMPIAMLIEQAGGLASDGSQPILDRRLHSLAQKTPLVFGSRDRVSEVTVHLTRPTSPSTRFPLFEHRGLLRSEGIS